MFYGKRNIGLAVTALAVALAGAPTAKANEKLVVVKGGTGLQYSMLIIAEKGGFFKQQGLDLDVEDLQSGPRQVAALMGGSADISVSGMVQVVKAHAQGNDQLVAVTSFQSGMDLTLVLSDQATKKTGITTDMPLDEKVKRLKGIRIGITSPGGSTDVFIRSLLKKRGVDPDTAIQILPLGGGNEMLAALQKGATDGFVWGAPQAQIAEDKHLGSIAINAADVPELKGMPYQGLVATRDEIKSKPELYRKLAVAIGNAIKFAKANEAKSKQYVESEFPNVKKLVFDAAWPAYYRLIPDSVLITPGQVKITADWLNITRKEPLKVNYTDIVYPTFAKAADKQVLDKNGD